MRRFSRAATLAIALLAMGVAACRGRVLTPAELADCASLAPLQLVLSLERVRVSAPAPLGATGGSGFYKFGVVAGGSGGELRGDRYIAGAVAATDTLFVEDQVCLTRDERTLEVLPSFDVAPSRAVIPPATTFQIATAGFLGAPTFRFVGNGSGATLSPEGVYAAGSADGNDLIEVIDSGSGEQAQLRFEVRAAANFRAVPNALAAPAGSFVELMAADSSDRVVWSKVGAGPGTIEGNVLSFDDSASGTTEVEAYDPFLNRRVTAVVRVLDELTRPVLPHGRLTDVGAVVTADFDRDGLEDIALGVPESDLGDSRGGAVLFFRGTGSGFEELPAWRILGTLGASLGTVLAVGDINDDGHPDLAVGAPNADVTVADSGGVYLYRFDASGPVLLRRALTGTGAARFGSAVALADIDGDGDDDLVVGSPRGDLASASNSRGVIDVFLLQQGNAILDYAQIRLSGWDLDAEGTAITRSQTRSGAAIAVADFNDDGRMDVASLGTITNRLLDGTALAASQPGIAVFFGRTGDRRLEPSPDLMLALREPADGNEGTYRLGFIPGDAGRPPLMSVFMDRADSPDLRASGGGNSATDAGGAFLFDLTAHRPTGTPAAKPVQIGRSGAFARFYGNSAGIAAGRSATVTNVDGLAGPELVLGAPYGQLGTGASAVRYSGRAIAFPLTGLVAGTVQNTPLLSLDGGPALGCFGTAMTAGASGLMVLASRASTDLGAFTGRLDVLSRAEGPANAWTRTSLPVAARAADELFGNAVAAGRSATGAVMALVGSQGFSGPGRDQDGNDLNAGRAWVLDLAGGTPLVAAEGAATPNIRGGRETGADVSFTDFDGDGRADLVIGAPLLASPSTNARATDITPHYALERAECVGTASPATGGAQIHLGLADGTFKPAFRIWAPQTIAGCTGSGCTRSNLGREVEGGFDFNGDGRTDLAATRTNGVEIFLGRAPDDGQLAKLTMACDPVMTASHPLATSALTAIGDLNGDGCDEVAYRTGDSTTNSSVVVAFGFDAGGARCGGRTVASSVRITDRDAAVQFLGLGAAITRAGAFLDGATDYLAISATSYPVAGVDQEAVLLYDIAEIVAARPASGTAVVGGIVDLTPEPFVLPTRVRTFGRSLAGGVDVTGDGRPELAIGAPGVTVGGSELATGAVFVFSGGRTTAAKQELVHLVGDAREAGDFGQTLSLIGADGASSPHLIIGAPRSFRTGARNGTAFAVPLRF